MFYIYRDEERGIGEKFIEVEAKEGKEEIKSTKLIIHSASYFVWNPHKNANI